MSETERIPYRPDFGSTPAGGSAHETRLQDEWDAKWCPDLETARRTIDALLTERCEDEMTLRRLRARMVSIGDELHAAAKVR